jgi:hypothetical protein
MILKIVSIMADILSVTLGSYVGFKIPREFMFDLYILINFSLPLNLN